MEYDQLFDFLKYLNLECMNDGLNHTSYAYHTDYYPQSILKMIYISPMSDKTKYEIRYTYKTRYKRECDLFCIEIFLDEHLANSSSTSYYTHHILSIHLDEMNYGVPIWYELHKSISFEDIFGDKIKQMNRIDRLNLLGI